MTGRLPGDFKDMKGFDSFQGSTHWLINVILCDRGILHPLSQTPGRWPHLSDWAFFVLGIKRYDEQFDKLRSVTKLINGISLEPRRSCGEYLTTHCHYYTLNCSSNIFEYFCIELTPLSLSMLTLNQWFPSHKVSFMTIIQNNRNI